MCQGALSRVGEGQGASDGLMEARQEEELTRQVPVLLDAMNRAASEINFLERQVCEAQEWYRRRLEHWGQLYKELRSHCGSSFDRIKPYFDRTEVALERVQEAVRDFSTAQQDALQEQRCFQGERDRLEWNCAGALGEHREALDALEMWRAQVGDTTIKRALPCLRLLRQHQKRLLVEQSRIAELFERTRDVKTAYRESLRDLEQISSAVHAARQEVAVQVKTADAEPTRATAARL